MKQYTSSNNRVLISAIDLSYALKNGQISWKDIKQEHVPHIANVPESMAACSYYAICYTRPRKHIIQDIDTELKTIATKAAKAHKECLALQRSDAKPEIQAYTYVFRTDCGYAVSKKALSYAADMLRPDVIKIRNITQEDLDETCFLPTLHAASLLSRYAQGNFYGPDADEHSHSNHIHNWASFRETNGCQECVIRDGSALLPLAAILTDSESSKSIHLGRAKLQLNLCNLYLASAAPAMVPVAG